MIVVDHYNRDAKKTHDPLRSASSGFALVCLYAIQMGSHTDSKSLAPRLLTLTTSMLTLLLFVYYANDITADITAGMQNKEPFVKKQHLTFGASICHANSMTLYTPKISC